MAKKNIDCGKSSEKLRPKCPNGGKFVTTPLPPSPPPSAAGIAAKGVDGPSRLSPGGRMPSPDGGGGARGTSPRTSPGLLAGHYAGCKWTEPPSPSALPLPPQHWMQATSSSTTSSAMSHPILVPFRKPKSDHYQQQQHHHYYHHHHDIASQLKVLLKVQA